MILRFAIYCLALCLLVACASEEDIAWEKAVAQNSSEAIDSFLLNYPETKYADDAEAVKQDYTWYAAKDRNTIYHYKKYLTTYPTGKYAEEVPSRIDSINKENLDLAELTRSTFIGKIDYGNRETQVLAFKFVEIRRDSAGISFVARIQTSDIKKIIDGRIDPKTYGIMFMEKDDTVMLNITDGRAYQKGNKLLLESTNVNQYWNLVKYEEG
ncbi:MAG: hypothetical protein ACRBFS_11090 [Aureispira sp.]